LIDTIALARYETHAIKVFRRDYSYGIMMNQRLAHYSAARRNKAVWRLARLSETEITQMLRSRFSMRLIARTLMLSLIAKQRK